MGVIVPKTWQGAILQLRLWKHDNTSEVVDVQERNMGAIKRQALRLLRDSTLYRSAELIGVLPSGEVVQPVYTGTVLSEALPYYVQWQEHGTWRCERFVKKTQAYKRYLDLVRQDYLSLTTNSFPRKGA